VQLPVYNKAGEAVSQIEVDEYVFNVPFNEPLVHQVVVGQQANARQGTAAAKTRGLVAGSTRKLYRQKGTGNARAGSLRSPLRRKGGIIFPPIPRDYRQDTPKKMRHLALRCVLSAKARDNELKVVEQLEMEAPKTKEMVGILAALGVESSALVVTEQVKENVVKSARNIPGVKTMTANLLNPLDLLASRMVVLTVPAVRKAEEIWGKPAAEDK
jgi:large subunit ribosomal protein L4